MPRVVLVHRNHTVNSYGINIGGSAVYSSFRNPEQTVEPEDQALLACQAPDCDAHFKLTIPAGWNQDHAQFVEKRLLNFKRYFLSLLLGLFLSASDWQFMVEVLGTTITILSIIALVVESVRLVIQRPAQYGLEHLNQPQVPASPHHYTTHKIVFV